MITKSQLKWTLLVGLFVVSLGGWLLHLRSHPPAEGHAADYIPFIAGIASVIVLPLLFMNARTLTFAYITNGMLVIIGTIAMAHFSLTRFAWPVTFQKILLGTTLPYILLAWGKFVFGKALFDLERYRPDLTVPHKGRFFRWPNMGWWWVHLAGFSIVYALGNIYWK